MASSASSSWAGTCPLSSPASSAAVVRPTSADAACTCPKVSHIGCGSTRQLQYRKADLSPCTVSIIASVQQQEVAALDKALPLRLHWHQQMQLHDMGH